jgi:hypothetical protein
MRLTTKVLACAVCVFAGGSLEGDVVTSVAERAAAASDLVARPSDGGEFGYRAQCTGSAGPDNPCRRLGGRYAVIHWVQTGPDAPPLNDDNGNRLPDYIDEIRAAADKSLAFYAAKRFKTPLPDTLGGDAKPDIYVRHFERTEGIFGVAFPHAIAAGGSFLIVGNDLDRNPERAVGGLGTTVAHELFHLVQFAYTPDGAMPRWIAEGTASAMELNVYPQIEDVATTDFLDLWLDETTRPLYDERFGCDRCYGGSLWWHFIFNLRKSGQATDDVLQEFFGRLEGYQAAGKPLLLGTQPLDEALRRNGWESTFNMFTYFSVSLYRERWIKKPTYTLKIKKTGTVQETDVLLVNGLSMHYIPVVSPRDARGLVVRVSTGGGPLPDVQLIIGGPRTRFIEPKVKKGSVRQFEFSAGFRRPSDRTHTYLIVTSGRQEGAKYLVQYGAYSR